MRATTMAAIKQRLLDVGLDTYADGGPKDTPQKRYVVLYDTSDASQQFSYAPGAASLQNGLSVVCVGRTRDTVRDVVRVVRLALQDWAPHPGASRMNERERGPFLSDGELGDQRVSSTLVYLFNEPRE